ncbi:MAG: hypothetical protein IKQ87_11095, partial [Clostridia bacterium]|nr:hypothetical protein [Clostridia bacterium]
MKLGKLLGILFALLLMAGLLSAGQTIMAEELPKLQNVSISANGVLNWDPFEGATEYSWLISTGGGLTTSTSVDLRGWLENHDEESGTYTVTLYAL